MNSDRRLIVAILIFVVIGVLAYVDLDVIEDKSFLTRYEQDGTTYGPYYQASISTARDPRAVYQEMATISILERGSYCDTKAVYANGAITVPGGQRWYCWVGTKDSKSGQAMSRDDGSQNVAVYEYITSGGFALQGLYNTGDKIVVPMEDMELLDSNVSYTDEDSISIKIAAGQFKLEFHNIQSWWCHMSSDNHTRHDTVVGINSSIDRVNKEQVVGTAKETTTVYIYKIDESTGEWSPYSFYEFYGIPAPNP